MTTAGHHPLNRLLELVVGDGGRVLIQGHEDRREQVLVGLRSPASGSRLGVRHVAVLAPVFVR